MNKPNKQFSVAECKIQASILLKSLHSAHPEKAIKRFQRLPEFNQYSLDELQQIIKRKHALLVIAMEKGFQSWSQLKLQLPLIRGGFLNQWFVNYHDAKEYQKNHGGYLFPFKNQFFICDSHYIAELGLDPNDPDWMACDFDWGYPSDQHAYRRLYQQWMNIVEKQS